MKKFITLTTLGLLSTQFIIIAQKDTIEKLSIKVGGYVRSETFFDTYQSVESRDGEIYYYPKRENLDFSGKDLNKIPQLEMLGLQSRLKITGSGTSALGAKVSGLLESDFTGTAEDYKFLLMLRHALIKLDWNKTQLLIGQWWHPMFIAEFSPNTVLFANAFAFQPFNRSVQIRVKQNISSKINVTGALLAHTYHRSKEISGNNSQRNSGLPDMHLQLQYGNINALFIAITGGYKFLKPYLSTTFDNNIYKATKIVGSYDFQVCLGYQFSYLSAKIQGNLGQNMTTYNMIGGYSPIAGTVNERGESDFANITTMSLWSDFETKGKKIKFGLFAGISNNLGAKDSLAIDERLCRDSNLKQIFRISPRLYIIQGAIDFGFEYVMTGAVYGTFIEKSIKDTDHATIDHRFLVSVRYSF
jgi:hypothetical protein